MTDKEYQYLTIKIRSIAGIDLDSYKSQQMRRRLASFIANDKTVNSVADYCRLLGQSEDRLKKLRKFITINVTEFFRDPKIFEQMRTLALSKLLRRSPHLNIWSAGCSHGGEPYTIAIILAELSPHHNHRILATDVDEGSLALARTGGSYSPQDIKNVSPLLLKKYFKSINGSYWISDQIKQGVKFAQHNLMRDPFGQGFDLVVCRNVAIYFTDQAKQRLNQKFYNSLKDGGILFIGATEFITDATGIGFTKIGNYLYEKRATSTTVPLQGRTPTLVKA